MLWVVARVVAIVSAERVSRKSLSAYLRAAHECRVNPSLHTPSLLATYEDTESLFL